MNRKILDALGYNDVSKRAFVLTEQHRSLSKLITAACIKSSSETLQQLANVCEPLVEEIVNTERTYVFGRFMALAAVATTHFRGVFKVHYGSDLALLGHFDLSQPDIHHDFAYEYCNQTVGYFRQYLEGAQLRSGAGRPIITSGSDELVYRKLQLPNQQCFYWRLIVQQQHFVCSVNIEYSVHKSTQAVLSGLIDKLEDALSSSAEQRLELF